MNGEIENTRARICVVDMVIYGLSRVSRRNYYIPRRKRYVVFYY